MFTSRTSIADPGTFDAEPDRDALVRLDPDDQGVLAEFLGVGGGERQVRRALEEHRDLRHPARQPLAGAQVERHSGPAPGVDGSLTAA